MLPEPKTAETQENTPIKHPTGLLRTAKGLVMWAPFDGIEIEHLAWCTRVVVKKSGAEVIKFDLSAAEAVHLGELLLGPKLQPVGMEML